MAEELNSMLMHPTGRRLARFSRPARIMAIIVAVTLAAGSTAALAAQAAGWTVEPGGAVSIVTAKLTLTDPDTGTILTCTSAKLTGTLGSGSGLQGAGAGSIAKAGFTKCQWPSGSNPDLKSALLPWHINLTSYRDGVVTGTVSNIGLLTANGACVAQITGDGKSDGIAKFRYNDNTNTGTFTGENLKVVNEICAAILYHKGDPISLSARFSMHPAQSITSP
jgi:hypothetical protein